MNCEYLFALVELIAVQAHFVLSHPLPPAILRGL